MKIKFLKKKFCLIILVLLLSNMFIACSNNEHEVISTNNKNHSISQEKEEKIPHKSIEREKVNGKVKLYEGTYFDHRAFGDNILTLKTYCEIEITNVTESSFDFTIYEVNVELKDKDIISKKEVIFLTNTASFIGKGEAAAFYGKEYTLNFEFPDERGTYPDVVEMRITGFEPLEGNTYVNNGVPGHEFSLQYYKERLIL